jgi:cytosine/adenosine deaminase-related metal-dependent hydrolase
VLGPQQFLLPGFIDTHAHAPQYQVGVALAVLTQHTGICFLGAQIS